MYRLLADVLNDVAMVLDCLSPVLGAGMGMGMGMGSGVRVGLLVAASVLRALCGVAAGSAKGCLSAHFARRGNLGMFANSRQSYFCTLWDMYFAVPERLRYVVYRAEQLR